MEARLGLSGAGPSLAALGWATAGPAGEKGAQTGSEISQLGAALPPAV